MTATVACSCCGSSIPETHLKAGYVRASAEGLLCPLCQSTARAKVWTVPERVVDLRRCAWILSGLSTAALSLVFLRVNNLMSVGVGFCFLVVSGCILVCKVGGADLR